VADDCHTQADYAVVDIVYDWRIHGRYLSTDSCQLAVICNTSLNTQQLSTAGRNLHPRTTQLINQRTRPDPTRWNGDPTTRPDRTLINNAASNCVNVCLNTKVLITQHIKRSTAHDRRRRRIHNNNNNNNSKTIFMVLSSWQNHCESSPGSFDECRTALSGRRPKTKPDDLGCESACTDCQSLHPPSPFIITQPGSWYSFYCPTQGRRVSRLSWLVTYRDGYPSTDGHPSWYYPGLT